jgi:DNA-directed RNA polymerase specialized sigma24 family protein
MDERLDTYLRAPDAGAEQGPLDELVSQCAEPIIQRTVAARLSGRWDDLEDVCSEARLELLLHLRRIKSQPGARAIEDFTAYVGALARNACHHYFRRRRSGRARLAAQLRFLLHELPFRSWQHHGRLCCGLAAWPDDRTAGTAPDYLSPAEGRRDLVLLLERIFELAAGPLDPDSLTELIASIWRIPPDSVPAPVDPDSLAAPAPGAELTIDRRRYAERLWRELRELPRPQRAALLLNLRDGSGAALLAMFPLSGVASFAEIAGVLELSEADLAAIWNDLPWDDNTVAGHLGCTRQQVINLRMSARKRLANRLGEQP